MKSKVAKVFAIVIILTIILFAAIQIYFSPTPNFRRNNSMNGVKVNIQVSNDERKPIVRTFEREEFESLSESKVMKVRDKIAGRIEGDIPCIHLNYDNKIYFEFTKDGKVYEPEIPKIKIFASASHYADDQKQRVIEGELDRLDDGRYFYETKRYSTQFEKYFLEYLRIEIYYTIDGVDYLSTFGTFQDNANDGTDFFDNENLEKPIPPEG
ncbi:MAG: hypothetical protein QP753_06000 [Peptoniphilus harei]|uniref:Uncharacterized protein n=1 Tax=Peptoniphilus harei ACS-146-V-Sch2b TaxID=908338 RepID=E4KZA5_9FIRM|nr:hypothetical protein [Peptoniphilus harei]EFR32818.1 conserved hypothetical protein [Peptoniphilus harei ACS-146-V-Sch2b]MDK7755870.1 hypothetical protein [Peptoniphilus harei]MDK7761338.1 hypothetical protein [Peptoniphilus harei]MDK8271159.1 hypothetical protein [Peptoniphilus harei]MDK8339703.1 hypothetical protein [Peptoniphilus harei]